MNLWLIEHFLTISFIKIRFSCNQNIGGTLTQLKKCLSNVLIQEKLIFFCIKIRISCNQNIVEALTQCKKVSLDCFNYRRI